MKLQIQALEKKYDKTLFDCGHSLLDEYIKKQAKQDVNRDLSACFVLVDDKNVVKGFYTLSANSIKRDDFPEPLQRKLPPSYNDIPTILLGRLAIDKTAKGNGFGEILLLDALTRSLKISESLGTIAVIVDPIDERAQNFYSKYGFILLPTSGKMFLPMKTIKDISVK
jgi:ribosomal protein S18 acetylase RimI-like enzyme